MITAFDFNPNKVSWFQGGTAGPPPPPSPTTAAPPPKSGCIDNWIEDGYCDDENNNAECQFDGGDCCNNSMENWDFYCSVS